VQRVALKQPLLLLTLPPRLPNKQTAPAHVI
jgi:hypothetical protein